MENAIRHKAVVVSSKVNVYTSPYQSSKKTVLMLLMKKYDIAVPMRTQGWINANLCSFKIDENRQVHGYNYRKTKSTVIFKCLQMLVSAVYNNDEAMNKLFGDDFMPQIIPIRDLKNTSAISTLCKQTNLYLSPKMVTAIW